MVPDHFQDRQPEKAFRNKIANFSVFIRTFSPFICLNTCILIFYVLSYRSETNKRKDFIMKKTLIALSLAAAALVSARDIRDNLDSAKVGDAMIPGWTINRSNKAADYGKSVIVVGSEADEKALKLTAPADRSNSIYMLGATTAKAGEFLEFSAKVKGKGTVTLSYYPYTAKGGFVGGVPVPYKAFVLSDSWVEIKCKLEVKNSRNGTIVGSIRPCVSLSKGGELFIEDIDLEIDND